MATSQPETSWCGMGNCMRDRLRSVGGRRSRVRPDGSLDSAGRRQPSIVSCQPGVGRPCLATGTRLGALETAPRSGLGAVVPHRQRAASPGGSASDPADHHAGRLSGVGARPYREFPARGRDVGKQAAPPRGRDPAALNRTQYKLSCAGCRGSCCAGRSASPCVRTSSPRRRRSSPECPSPGAGGGGVAHRPGDRSAGRHLLGGAPGHRGRLCGAQRRPGGA